MPSACFDANSNDCKNANLLTHLKHAEGMYVMTQFAFTYCAPFPPVIISHWENKKIALCGGEPRERFAMLGFIVFYAIGD